MEKSKKLGEIRFCRICNKCIEEAKYIITVDGYKHRYYHNECYKYLYERFLSNK